MSRPRRFALLALAFFFVAAGANHFLNPAFYIQIVPPYLPAPELAVLLSGILEIAGGLAVLVPRLRARAGWGLVALLAAVFPANVHMALHPELFPQIAPAALMARLPVQALLAGWAIWATRLEATHAGLGRQTGH